MNNVTVFVLFLLTLYPNYLIAVEDSCLEHKTCGDCIKDNSICDWCASTLPAFDSEARCRRKGSYDATWCLGAIDITEKTGTVASVNKNFSSETDKVVQIKPQEFSVTLRPGQPETFQFSFQGAENYPVDLYVLLDASKTMKGIKKQIGDQALDIYNTMFNMTKKVALGFGTFIDKNTLPFTIPIPETRNNKTYSFRNSLNLTSKYKSFKDKVEETTFGVNYDLPEGGFDALAQVLACDVGWRNNSRRIVVFFTDSLHHAAGEGRAAGIFEPFDGHCYTDKAGVYTKELEMDFPSIPMINKLASDNKVTIIFALQDTQTEEYEPIYKKLKDAIRGSKLALLKGKHNIQKLLIESYMEISTNIILEVQSKHKKRFDIKFNPNCIKNSEDCIVNTGERLDFTGTITLKEYYGQNSEVIDIFIQGMNEKLRLNVNVVKCSCEATEDLNSSYCNEQKRQCGVCICNENRSGNQCQCAKGKDDKTPTNSEYCMSPGGELCSGTKRGECICDSCKCSSTTLGKFCECDLEYCPGVERKNGIISSVCGGYGNCTCGENEFNGRKEVCSCEKDWILKPGAEHLGCTCHNVTNSCIKVGHDGTVCNNRGKCECDSCVCDAIPKWDKRGVQDSQCHVNPSPDHHSMQCTYLRNYVSDIMHSGNCTKDCDGVIVEQKYSELPKELIESPEWHLCDNQKVNLGCYTNFVYRYDDTNYTIQIRIEEKPNCAESHYVYGGLLLGSLLVIGILTILAWKCLTNYWDRKEFEAFEKNNQDVLYSPSVNGLYEAPTTTFRNPAFISSMK